MEQRNQADALPDTVGELVSFDQPLDSSSHVFFFLWSMPTLKYSKDDRREIDWEKAGLGR